MAALQLLCVMLASEPFMLSSQLCAASFTSMQHLCLCVALSGHLLGGASAVEAVATIKAIQTGEGGCWLACWPACSDACMTRPVVQVHLACPESLSRPPAPAIRYP